MYIFLGIIVGLLCLMFLIVAHEFGHFITARKSGVRVKEFGVGFPPRIAAWLITKDKSGKRKWQKLPKSDWDKDQKNLIFSINALPIGGFCAMDGESDADTKPGTFGSVSYWKKTLILFGGVAMNWLIAFLILTVLAWTGLPTILDNQFSIKSDEHVRILEPVIVAEVVKDSPAEQAGFKQGDKIVSIFENDFNIDYCNRVGVSANGSPCVNPDETKVYSSSDVISFNDSHASKTVYYIVEREEEAEVDCYQEPCNPPKTLTTNKYTLKATLNDNSSDYLLGITMNYGSSETHYTWSAPIVGAGLTVQITGETFKGLGKLVVDLFTGAIQQVSPDATVRQEGREQVKTATEGVSGIVGIIGGYFPSLVQSGPSLVFLFMAVISISLACMNVLPIPALDGGRWFMITLARLRHKKLSQETEQNIVAKTFIFLLILMAIITVMDIIRLF